MTQRRNYQHTSMVCARVLFVVGAYALIYLGALRA